MRKGIDKMEAFNTQRNIFMILIVILALVITIPFTYFHVNDRMLMSQNIESAIQKGIDPMTVRCSYVEGNDNICIAFAIRNRNIDAPSAPLKK